MITNEQIANLKNLTRCGLWADQVVALRAAIDTLEAQSARMAELEANLNLAGNLLAIIHRDGGHHTARVGFAESLRDAADKWYAMLTERDALAANQKSAMQGQTEAGAGETSVK